MKKEFPKKSVFRTVDVFGVCWKVILGVSEEISVSLQAFWLGAVTGNDERGSFKLSAEVD